MGKDIYFFKHPTANEIQKSHIISEFHFISFFFYIEAGIHELDQKQIKEEHPNIDMEQTSLTKQ